MSNLGVFNLDHKESVETKRKRISSLVIAWKKRNDSIADIKHPYIHNSWRSIRHTIKGKNIGSDERWSKYRNFYNDVFPTYIEGYTLQRLDKNQSFGPDNFIWIPQKVTSLLREKTIRITYKKETLTINEWAEKLELSANGIKLRYHRNKDYSIEEILLGKKRLPSRSKLNAQELVYKELKDKASKMCSSYRIKDKKKRFEFNLDTNWLIENILLKKCTYCDDDKYIGCDRIDNSKGHIKSNVVPCCQTCNMARGDNFTVDEMIVLGRCISEIKNKRTEFINLTQTS